MKHHFHSPWFAVRRRNAMPPQSEVSLLQALFRRSQHHRSRPLWRELTKSIAARSKSSISTLAAHGKHLSTCTASRIVGLHCSSDGFKSFRTAVIPRTAYITPTLISLKTGSFDGNELASVECLFAVLEEKRTNDAQRWRSISIE